MIFRNVVLSLGAVAAFSLAGCGSKALIKARLDAPAATETILVNQEGYLPGATKVALLRADADIFELVDVTTGRNVYAAEPGDPQYWELSGDTVRSADFSAFSKPGTYRICLEGSDVCSAPFRIGDDVYSEITRGAVRSYYLNRSGIEITEEYGGKWARPAGHPDTAVIIHTSAASAGRPAGTAISSPGGWYDAGEYNK